LFGFHGAILVSAPWRRGMALDCLAAAAKGNIVNKKEMMGPQGRRSELDAHERP
jgi:hypothetical protein